MTQTFPEVLVSRQQRLLSYIVSFFGDVNAAWDVLQATNRGLLEKREGFQIGTSFLNWALSTLRGVSVRATGFGDTTGVIDERFET
ncbi:hypothetical protein CA13_28910 [Planctomycetes bacterium CA13]|uniref:RNA polymerase sigma-70 region 2 domain-containing protein n=1 Tax=Novipirellula herctigrandis TaxID=2527986 RepID=A0A5C5Z282_9BACT|nr:hypothetical protein CA13_28910 [Planctomycetes bacterium CA13]